MLCRIGLYLLLISHLIFSNSASFQNTINNTLLLWENAGLVLESDGMIFLSDGLTYHNMIVGIPNTVTDKFFDLQCNGENMQTKLQMQYAIDRFYIDQVKDIQEEIPENNILTLLGCPLRSCPELNNTHLIKSEIMHDIHHRERSINSYKGFLEDLCKNIDKEGKLKINPLDKIPPECALCKNSIKCKSIRDDRIHSVGVRKKRELVTLMVMGAAIALGGVGAVTSLMNAGKLGTIQDNMNEVESRLPEIITQINQINTDKHTIKERLNNITTIILPDMINYMNTLEYDLQCDRIHMMLFVNQLTNIISGIPNKMRRIINSMYSGKITPDILPMNKIKEMLDSRNDLKDSIYIKYPELIYEFGSISLIRIVHLPMLVHAILIIPKIHESNINIRYKAIPVNVIINEKNSILNMHPLIGYDIRSTSYWDVDYRSCKQSTRFSICPIENVLIQPNHCISGLQNSTVAGCIFTELPKNMQYTKQTSFGVYIGSTSGHYKLIKYIPNKKPITKTVHLINKPSFVYNSYFDYLEINDTVFSFKEETIDVELTEILSNVTFPFNHTNAHVIDLDPIPNPDPVVLDDLKFKMHMESGISLGCIILLIILFSLYMYKRNRVMKFDHPPQLKLEKMIRLP